MKKITKKSILFIGLAFVFGAMLVSTACSQIKTPDKQNNETPKETPNTSIPSSSLISSNIIEYQDRQSNKEYYTTNLEEQYSQYGFKYPGYDFSYKNSNNRYLNVNGENIDLSQKVYDETVTYNNNNTNVTSRYSDPNFILNEIENNKLKKHPAVKNFYQQEILDSTKSIEKELILNSTIKGYTATGIYAPPGEILTLELDDNSYEHIVKNNTFFKVIINDNFRDNTAPNKQGQITDRYPFINTRFNVENKTIKFGSPFGGAVSLYIATPSLPLAETTNIKLKISGGIETLYYQNGVVSENDWNKQIKRLKNNEITAPAFAANISLGSMNIPFTNKNEIAYLNIDDITFPGPIIEKFNEFMFLSKYIQNYEPKKLTFRFYNDIQAGGAFANGEGTHCPISWGRDFFLKGQQGLEISQSWGFLHETNHNYEPKAALFRKNLDGFTNTTTTLALSLLSDQGRWRSEQNPLFEYDNQGWNKLRSSFSTIKTTKEWGGSDEYVLYASLAYLLGTKNFMDYIRWDVLNHPNVWDQWTPFGEIYNMSNYFKFNLWPLFKNYHKYWNDNWPQNEQAATIEERAKIEELNTKFPAIDLVGNLYAAGSYKFNQETKQFEYTNDNTTPYEIVPMDDYVFDFENNINSLNEGFSWSNLEFDSVSKNGIKIEKDPSNPKKLIYKASEKFTPEVDEFNVMIKNINYPNKPANYVPGYKWKIKVRQAVDSGPAVYSYDNINPNESFNNIVSQIKNSNPSRTWDFNLDRWRENLFYNNDKVKNIRFKFIAPEDGEYKFKSLWDGSISLRINNKEVLNRETSNSNIHYILRTKLSKNQVVDFDIILKKTGRTGKLIMTGEVNNNNFNLLDKIVTQNINKLGLEETPSSYLTKDIYKYKERRLNLSEFPNNEYVSKEMKNIINTNQYRLWSEYDKSGSGRLENLNDIGEDYFELWNNDAGPGKGKSTFEITFKKPTDVQNFYFGHRTNNHMYARPTDIKITGIDNDGNITELFNGEYVHKNRYFSEVNLNKKFKAKTVKFELTNRFYAAVILQWFRVS